MIHHDELLALTVPIKESLDLVGFELLNLKRRTEEAILNLLTEDAAR